MSKPNQFKYNGKELNTEFDIGVYDYGKRQYDPQLGRFMQVDPLTDLAFNQNPYHYVMNNPMIFNDPSGMAAKFYYDDESGEYIKEKKNGKKKVVSWQRAFAAHGISTGGNGDNDNGKNSQESNYIDYEIDKENGVHIFQFTTTTSRTVNVQTGAYSAVQKREKTNKTITIKVKVVNGKPTVIFESLTVNASIDKVGLSFMGVGNKNQDEVTVEADVSDNNYSAFTKALVDKINAQLTLKPDWNPFEESVDNSVVQNVGLALGLVTLSGGKSGLPGKGWSTVGWYLTGFLLADQVDDYLRPIFRNKARIFTTNTLVK
ncbi:hypothetical protein GCM10011340_35960 [Roseivirga thermotolerans]|uniref:RHS repeat-associated core domain-containing protein n=1 Tax=Roseivirga thermotolerans TaxID=1758176 RepID=A0ABQ3IFI8_9BACT|nr:hypothetical protein GCM10011340_35960 [Roseivirga thermotolerans]